MHRMDMMMDGFYDDYGDEDRDDDDDDDVYVPKAGEIIIPPVVELETLITQPEAT